MCIQPSDIAIFLTALGLILDIVGVVMLSITTTAERMAHEMWTGVARHFTDPHGEWVGPTSYEEHERRLRASEKAVKSNRRRQKIALGLIIVGFASQIIGILILIIDRF